MTVSQPKHSSVTPRIAELADRLLTDIATRGLQPGDRYLTAADAAKFLGVSAGPANRALQLLERRRVIERQQRSGARILDPCGGEQATQLHRVHFLVHPLFLRTEGIASDSLLLGIQGQLPGAQVQITYLPPNDEASFVQQLIGQSLGANATDGFILVRASCETQRLVAGSGLPAVVFGNVYPGVGKLACVGRDMSRVGCLLANRMLAEGHEHFAYLGRQLTYPGDHFTIDAIMASLASAGLLTDRLSFRFLPADARVCLGQVELLLGSAKPPTALICRTLRIAQAVRTAIEARGRSWEDFAIGVCDYYLREREQPEFMFPRPLTSDEEQGRMLARVLSDQIEQPGVSRAISQNLEHVVLPVELAFP